MLKSRGFVFIFPIILIVVGLGGGTAAVVASQNSLPGDALYSVKELTESVQITLTRDDKKAELYLKLAEKKLEEIQKLEEKGASIDKIARANERFQKYQRSASELVSAGQGEEIIQKLEEGAKKQKDVLHKILEKSSEETKEKVRETIASSQQEGQKLVEETKQKTESTSNSSTQIQTVVTNVASSAPTTAASPVIVTTPKPSPQATPVASPVPTPNPSPVANQNATLVVYAQDRAESPSNPLYQGIVKVKNPTSGAVVASGVTEPGYLRLENISIGTYDVVLLKPSSYQSDTCGQKQSVTLTTGNTSSIYMRLSGIAVSGYPCVRD